MQREIDACRREERERVGLARKWLVGAVDDAVVKLREVRRIEDIAHRHQALACQITLEMDPLSEGEVDRNRLLRYADFDRDTVILRQKPQLLAIVVPEEVGASHGRLIHARPRDETVRSARIHVSIDFGLYAHERIAGPHALGERLVTAIASEGVA